MVVALSILSVVCLILLLITMNMYSEKERLEKKIINGDSYFSFYPGKKALLYMYPLKNGKGETFNVNYQVDILEVSKNKIKVTAYDFTSDDALGKDPSMRTGILNFMKERWVDKKYSEVMLDEESIRDKKLGEILDD